MYGPASRSHVPSLLHRQQGVGDHLIHVFYWNNGEALSNLGGELSDVFLIELRDKHLGDPSVQRRERFLLQTPDGQNHTPQRDFAGHRDIFVHSTPREK